MQMTDFGLTRRGTLALGAGIATLGGARRASAQNPAEVKVALLAPISGPWARQGLLMKMGAEMAIDDINASGGIRSLGGARMKLVIYDAGDSVEKAKNAAQRMVAQDPDIVGGTGAWLSSFTLAVTEVTERAEIPWLTLSYADSLTTRGFRYIFQNSPTNDNQAIAILPTLMQLAERATGRKPTRLGMISDSTASPQSFVRPVRATEAAKHGLRIVVDETFTPPLSDATPLIQKVRSARPDFLLFIATNVPDDKLVMEKLNEYGLGQAKLPTIGNGGHMAVPELVQLTGPEILEGLMVCMANWPGKEQEALTRRFVERTKEPWMGHDSIFPYADMMILREAMERAGSADKRKVAEAIRGFDIRNEGPALFFPSKRLKFDSRGRLEDAQLVTVQWKSGVPVLVDPPSMAVAEAYWPKG
jgi:branched-chain amino acid transport system substrate-binding protein